MSAVEIELRQINPHIVCSLCAGYFIDACTIMECLHSFCKSCIAKHFLTYKNCPTCNILVHETNPMEMLRLDRTLQAIVFKIVKGLAEAEAECERAYYEGLGVPNPNGDAQKTAGAAAAAGAVAEPEEPAPKRPRKASGNIGDISLVLTLHDADNEETTNTKITQLEKPYIRTTTNATIMHLKRFLAKKLNLDRPDDVDILCRGEVLGREYSLEYLAKTRWRKDEQLVLTYRPKIDFEI